ncbi:MAG: VWA domain-containing protein [Planctomycetes bacterium]|nr:VWA domain-containing protein [Planctomycetota bacterium]
MSWGHPEMFWLLGALAIAAALRFALGRRVRWKLRSIGAGSEHLTPRVGRRREHLRVGLMWSGLAVIVLAMAAPRWGTVESIRRQTGADLLLLIDCSRSMLATDLYPNRLEVARRKALELVEQSPETRMALMPFAAIAVLRCPLTGDRNALAQMLEDCSPDLFPAKAGLQGSAIGDATSQGLQVLTRQAERGQAILVMSDGSDDDQESVERAAQAAKAAGVAVFGMFLGDPDKTTTIEIDGHLETMSASRTTLDRLAEATGGACVNATTDASDITALHQRIVATVAQRPWEERHRVVATERYHWFLVPGLAAVILGLLLPTRRRLRDGAPATPRRMAS